MIFPATVKFLYRRNRYLGFALVLVTGLIFIRWSSRTAPPQSDIRTSTFARLERIRQAKKQDLIFYFQNLKRQAREIDGDSRMLEYFFQFKRDNNVARDRLETELEIHYVVNYSDFYDILFVDTSGYVFHTIKWESDYHTYFRVKSVWELGEAQCPYGIASWLEWAFTRFELRMTDGGSFFLLSPQKQQVTYRSQKELS